MQKTIENRVIKEAKYIIDTKNTIRQAATKFNISKSTIHKDLNERLKKIDPILYKKIKIIFKNHIETRHIRGGIKTKLKFLIKD